MSLNVIVKPNADFTSGNITRALLNQAAKPTVAVAGSVGTEEIEALSITGAKIADDTLGGSKLQVQAVELKNLVNLGRGNVIVGQAKNEEDNIDGGATVALKLPQNGFLVGDGNDVKAMIFDNSASGAISMTQYTDSSTGDTSFKYDLRGQGVKSAHISSRAINLDKLSPNGGTASTDSTHSALITYDGGELADVENYGKAILTQAGGAGTVLRSGGKGEPMTFGSVMRFSSTSSSTLANTSGRHYQIAHNFTASDGTTKVIPSLIRGVLVCSDSNGEHGYSQNDEVDIMSISNQTDSDNEFVTLCADDTHVTVGIGFTAAKLKHKTAYTVHNITANKWKLKVYAAY